MVKKRLLCLMQLPPPIHGASVINAQVARSAILASRFELDVLPMHFAQSVDDISRVSSRKLVRSLALGVRLTAALVRHRPDAVYFTLSPSGGAFFRDCLYVAIMKSFGVPRIYHMHGKGVAAQLGVRWRRLTYRWVFRDAHVIHLSPLLASDTEGVVERAQLRFVPNGIPDDHEDASAIAGRAARPGPPRVLFLSNIAETKGPLVLLEALGLLAARGIAFEATFAGAPFKASCVAALEDGIVARGLGDQVRYIGPVYGDAKDALFRDHDVFAFPTYLDAFPLVVLEAMRRGMPVVATREGAIPEIVDDGRTGFLVNQRDAVALADRLERLLRDATLRLTMGQAGRQRYLERLTLACFESNLATALAECM